MDREMREFHLAVEKDMGSFGSRKILRDFGGIFPNMTEMLELSRIVF